MTTRSSHLLRSVSDDFRKVLVFRLLMHFLLKESQCLDNNKDFIYRANLFNNTLNMQYGPRTDKLKKQSFKYIQQNRRPIWYVNAIDNNQQHQHFKQSAFTLK